MGVGYPNEEIKEKHLVGQPIALSRKQYKKILKQQEKSLCQIISNNGKATGFLCNIPSPVLITANHVLDKAQLEPGKEIIVNFTDENEKKHFKTIKIDEKRNIYTIGKLNNEDIDTTIIELRPGEDGLNEQEFMEIDDELMNDDEVKNSYQKIDIYVIQYKFEGEIVTSNGIINEMKKEEKSYTLYHTCDTSFGSSGSPIILYNHKVIGFHRGWAPGEEYNRATLLQYPIKEYNKKLEERELGIKNENNINEDVTKNGNSEKPNDENNKKMIDDNFDKKIKINENNHNKITMIHKINNKENKIKILGKKFIKNNKENCRLIINKKEYDICEYIEYDKYSINKNDAFLTIILTGVNNIINAEYMFAGCNNLQSLPDISNWNTKNITSMYNMFYGCSSLETLPDISKWDTENVMSMGYMFAGCNHLKSLPDFSNWNTKNITDMGYMFNNCSSLQSLPDFSKWNTSSVMNMNYMFYNCTSLQSLPDISKWDTKNIKSNSDMFVGCESSLIIPSKFC